MIVLQIFLGQSFIEDEILCMVQNPYLSAYFLKQKSVYCILLLQWNIMLVAQHKAIAIAHL